MNPGSRPTMQVVADAAGVSRATVSRALRNQPSLPLATRRRIQAVARDLGYRPHPWIAALMANLKRARSPRSRETIAYVTAWPTREGWRRFDDSRGCFEGAQERAGKLGYQLEHFWLKEAGMTARRLSQILATRGIHGVIIGPLLRSVGHLSLAWPQFAAVTLGSSLRKPDLHRVSIHQYHNVNLAYRELRHRGYRKIGLLTFEDLERRVDYIRVAAMHAQQHWVSPARMIPSLLLKEWDQGVFQRWLEKYQPAALIGVDYIRAERLADLLPSLPKTLGFATLNWSEDHPELAGVHPNPRLLGAAAVDLVVGQLQDHEYGLPAHPKTVLIRGTWRDGKSASQGVLRKKEQARGVA